MYSLLANLSGSTVLSWHFGTTDVSIPHPSLFSFVNLMHESLRVELSNWNIVSFSRGSLMWLLWQVWSAHVPSLWIFTKLTVREPCHALDSSSLHTEIMSWFFVQLVFLLTRFARIPLVRSPSATAYILGQSHGPTFFPSCFLQLPLYLFVHNRHLLLWWFRCVVLWEGIQNLADVTRHQVTNFSIFTSLYWKWVQAELVVINLCPLYIVKYYWSLKTSLFQAAFDTPVLASILNVKPLGF